MAETKKKAPETKDVVKETAALVENVAKEVKKTAEKKTAEAKKAVEKATAETKKVVEKATAETKKVVEKKVAETKKAVEKAVSVKETVYVQFAGEEFNTAELLKNAVEAYKAEHKDAVKTVDLYVKPEERAAYYVVNGETGKLTF